MNEARKLPTIAIIAVVLAGACSRKTDHTNNPTGFTDGGASVLNRISEYFITSVTPKLGQPWSQLKGQGAIAVED